MPCLYIHPDNPLIDEKVFIKVTGLSASQPITIHVSVVENSAGFGSYGCYTADDHGNVDVNTSPSLHGTYSGIEDMGLFWSMKQEPGHDKQLRLIKKDVTTSLDFSVSVYSDHLTWNEIYTEISKPIASGCVHRWYKAKHVKRITVRRGQIRGALFIPEGTGSFPGVIDMFGGTGGLMDFRAALLASRGFVALALAYIKYEDIVFVESTDYYQEAIDYLLSLPMVIKRGIGLIGVSAGATVSLLVATHCEKISAAVVINGPPFVTLPTQHGDTLLKIPDKGGFNVFKGKICPEGIFFKDSFVDFDKSDVFQVWNRDVKILCIAGGDDQCVHPWVTKSIYTACPVDKRTKIQVLEYPGAGHLIEPPYSPLCRASYVSIYGFPEVWGGSMKEHALAQEDSWNKILIFLRNTLVNNDKKCLL